MTAHTANPRQNQREPDVPKPARGQAGSAPIRVCQSASVSDRVCRQAIAGAQPSMSRARVGSPAANVISEGRSFPRIQIDLGLHAGQG